MNEWMNPGTITSKHEQLFSADLTDFFFLFFMDVCWHEKQFKSSQL
jgi:hypothetical protein